MRRRDVTGVACLLGCGGPRPASLAWQSRGGSRGLSVGASERSVPRWLERLHCVMLAVVGAFDNGKHNTGKSQDEGVRHAIQKAQCSKNSRQDKCTHRVMLCRQLPRQQALEEPCLLTEQTWLNLSVAPTAGQKPRTRRMQKSISSRRRSCEYD